MMLLFFFSWLSSIYGCDVVVQRDDFYVDIHGQAKYVLTQNISIKNDNNKH